MKVRWEGRLYFALEPVDMRLSFDRLSGLVRNELGHDPRGESLFIFCNKRRTHLKCLWYDGTGYTVLFKRLEGRRFRVPLPIPADAKQVELSQRELSVLLRGIDRKLLRAARRTARSV